eukprot:GSChrysophyteH1.ASY1.ANO1.48.1 assembled CDS
MELREELRSPKLDRKRDAVKKVIANMTVGKDVSALFADVVNCIQTENLELKKLVYLYLINYAKTQPDLALLAVNTFVKDANDPNPLIRALAIRTMGCIRVEKITEYLCEPLNRCLKDEDPYVRKTAAVCVAKLHDISPELVEDRGFLEVLRDLISDANPTVVANAKLLAALNECTEWGQVFILDSLSKYVPTDAREAEGIIERVTPRLQHANSAVVMSAVKVILKYMDEISSNPNNDIIRGMCKKLAPPLVTLLNSEPEIQYVALRNINLITIDQVLLELKEYATEVDVEFDIFRKYPNRYEAIIGTLCENLEDLDEPEAKASMIWIIGEYAERIDNADELLDSFLDSFADETAQAARAVVLSAKPEIGDDTFYLDPTLLEDLISQIATLSSIYHKPPESFVMKTVVSNTEEDDDDGYDEDTGAAGSPGGGGDLLDLMDDSPAPGASAASEVQKTQYLTPEAGKGLSIMGALVNQGGSISVVMDVTNQTSSPTSALAIQLNKNGWGLAPVSPQVPLSNPISNGSTCSCTVNLKVDAPPGGLEPGATVQAAVKNMSTGDVVYFHIPVMVEALFVAGPEMATNAFAGQWKAMTDEASIVVNNVPTTDIEAVKQKFSSNNLTFIASRPIPNTDQTAVYFAGKVAYPSTDFYIEVKFKAGANICKVTVKSTSNPQSEIVKAAVARIVG